MKSGHRTTSLARTSRRRRRTPASTHEFVKEVLLPVHEFVRLSPAEIEIIDHPAVQRLRNVSQLGFTSLVYPGGSHSRLEHSLGTVHVASLIADRLDATTVRRRLARIERDAGNSEPAEEPLTQLERCFVRLTALLHDVGHMSFGHTLEDQAGMLVRHDSLKRVREAFTRNWTNDYVVPTLAELIDNLFVGQARSDGFEGSVSDAVIALIVNDDDVEDRFVVDTMSRNTNLRWFVIRDIVSDTLCADSLDYLSRDSYHLGKPFPLSTRLLDFLEIRTVDEGRQRRARIVLNLVKRNAFRADSVTELLDLLARRQLLFEIAYYHRTKLCADSMLERLLHEMYLLLFPNSWDQFGDWLLETLWATGDAGLLSVCVDELAAVTGSDERERRAGDLLRLARSLQQRRIHKEVFSLSLGQCVPAVYEDNVSTFGGRKGSSNRLALAQEIESLLGLPLGSVAIHSPARLQLKESKLKVYVDGVVRSIAEQEELVRRGHAVTNLTNDALQAGAARFAGLWRITVCVAADEFDLENEDLVNVVNSYLSMAFGLESRVLSPARLSSKIGAEVIAVAPESGLARVFETPGNLDARIEREVSRFAGGPPRLNPDARLIPGGRLLRMSEWVTVPEFPSDRLDLGE